MARRGLPLLLLMGIAAGALAHALMVPRASVTQWIPPAHRTAAVTAKAPPRKPQPVVATYTVRPGDTLSGIAMAHCPKMSDWVHLQGSNHITGDLSLGEVIRLACS